LFGGYRDPQESALSLGFDDNFFNDALDVDFITPYNLPITSPAAPKKDLISQIDAAKEADETPTPGKLVDCNAVWYVSTDYEEVHTRHSHTDKYNREKISNCPNAKSGDFDLEGLCADLQKKAKCDGNGPVVSEADFHSALKKYLCKDEAAADRVAAAAMQTKVQPQTQTQV
jgi:AP-1-like factor